MAIALSYDPQKALLVDHPPSGNQWLHELKLDGYRMGVLIDGTDVRIVSRRGTEYTAAFPEIVAAAKTVRAKEAAIDGEIVVLDERGISRFQRLQHLAASRRGLTYFAFDLLALDGTSLVRLPLEARKARLERLLADSSTDIIRYCPHFDADGAEVFAKACALGAEGIVSKRRDAPYRIGVRSADWQKTKCVKRQEFVIGGFTDPEGSRQGVGSILVGYYEEGSLRFAGKVGTGRGWSDAFSRALRERLEKIEVAKSPFHPVPPGWLGRNAHWVRPEPVVEVEFTEWTTGGHIRHPTLRGFRSDKPPTDVTREREAHLEAPSTNVSSKASVVFPRLHKTTADLVALYAEIAERVLPHVQNRPLTLVRLRQPITREDALRTQAVFVHHTARDQGFVPENVPRVRVRETKKIGEYCYIDSEESLLGLIAAGVVEWHAWNATVDDPEHPDRIVFDIDPGSGVKWALVVRAARDLRTYLRGYDLESWVKTTGGKGLHVVVPFQAEHSWDVVFSFSRAAASALVERQPDHYTLSFGKADRAGKILIDYKRNYRTSIAVGAYSMRARPNGAVSVPVSWKELARVDASDRWTVENIRRRVRGQRSDPWSDYWRSRQRLFMDQG